MTTFLVKKFNADALIHMIHKLMERHDIENPNSVMKFGDTQKDVLEGINAHCIASIGVLSGADNEKQLQEANADPCFE